MPFSYQLPFLIRLMCFNRKIQQVNFHSHIAGSSSGEFQHDVPFIKHRKSDTKTVDNPVSDFFLMCTVSNKLGLMTKR